METIATQRRFRCALLTVMIVGCYDPGKSFDDFALRQAKIRDAATSDADLSDAEVPDAPDANACVQPTSAQIDGTFLLGIGTVLDPEKPVVAEITMRATSEDPLLVDFRIQLLNPQTFEESGDPVDTVLNWEGTSFHTDDTTVPLPGDANPLLPGISGVALISISGEQCANADGITPIESLCGDAEGSLTEPLELSLNPATFAAMRVNKGDEYTHPARSCAELEGQ